MTRENAKQLLPIITAFSEGKQIQVAYGQKWLDARNPSFDGDPCSYRIQPEPREFWINFPHMGDYGFKTKEEAKRFNTGDYTPILVREVL